MSDIPYLLDKIQAGSKAALEVVQAFTDIYSDPDFAERAGEGISEEQEFLGGHLVRYAEISERLLAFIEQSQVFNEWKTQNYI